MAFDARKNFAYSTVATAPTPATSGTSLIVQGGDGAKFPAAPFNAMIWPAGVQPSTANAEIVRVTAKATDTFTITRAQESSVARTVIATDQIAQVLTDKTLKDIEDILSGVSGGVLSDEFMGDVFDSQSSLKRDVVLLASTDFIAIDVVDIGSAGSLEIPATSSLEIMVYQPAPPVTAYIGLNDFIESGCVWTPDAAGSTLLASMSEGFMWLGGRRLYVPAIKARAFTANRDTYVDFKDNNDGTAVPVYTENTNNVATGAPILPDRQIRNAIIVSGATAIAAASSINQGQENIVLPIVSSVPYTVTDNLGNLICPRDPQRKLLGYRQITANVTATTQAQLTGLSCPVNITQNILGRKLKISLVFPDTRNSSSLQDATSSIWDGVVGSGTRLNYKVGTVPTAAGAVGNDCEAISTPAAIGLKTYNAAGASSSGTVTYAASATSPAYIKVELE